MSRNGNLLLVAATTGLLGFVIGVNSSGRLEQPPSHLELLSRDLTLRPDQKAAIGALLARQDRELQELVERARSDLANPTAARLQQTEDEMLALLDAQQRERYQSLVSAHNADAR